MSRKPGSVHRQQILFLHEEAILLSSPLKPSLTPLLNSLFLLTFCIFLIAQPLIRDRSGVVFWTFVIIAVLYALATSQLIMVRPLLFFTLIGLLYIILSYMDVLPDAWTQMYERAVIPRQAFYVVLLYPLVIAASSMWLYASRSRNTLRFFIIIFITVAGIAPLVAVLLNHSGLVSTYASITTGGFGNAHLMFYMALTYFLLIHIKNVAIARVYTLLVMAVIFLSFFYLMNDPQLQNMIGLAVLLLLTFIRPRRKTVAALAVAGVVLYAALIPFAERVYVADPNSGYRLVLTKDALRAFTESYGAGVGFGKEVVTNEYYKYGISPSPIGTDSAELAVQGAHNSFAQEFMRLGILGGGFLLWLFFGTCSPPHDGPLQVRRHLAVVYFFLLISMMANVALESPTYLVGIAFAVGYVLGTKDRLSLQHQQLQASPVRSARAPTGRLDTQPSESCLT